MGTRIFTGCICVLSLWLGACSRSFQPAVRVVGASDYRSPDLIGTRLVKSTIWEGERLIDHNIFIPREYSLTIAPGSRLTFLLKKRRRLDTPFIAHRVQIMVAGQLWIKGEKDRPVIMRSMEKEKWQGIILLPGGEAHIRQAALKNVVAGITSFSGKYRLSDTVIEDFEYGIYAHRSQGEWSNLRLERGTYGVYTDATDQLKPVCHQVKYPFRFYRAKESDFPEISRPASRRAPEWKRKLIGRIDVNHNETWEGDILVSRTIRVNKGATLTLKPGTRIFFQYFDSNGDGVGEGGILVSGRIVAKGNRGRKIILRSWKPEHRWAGISIIDSDSQTNLFEGVEIRDAVRGIHGHFADVSVRKSMFENNVSDLEFQDSRYDISGSTFKNSLTGIRFRDSQLNFHDNLIVAGVNGIEGYKSGITIKNCRIAGKANFALKARKSKVSVSGSLWENNRKGIMLYQSEGVLAGNRLLNQRENGVYVSTSRVSLSSNLIRENGFDGLTLKESRVTLTNNQVLDNQHDGMALNQAVLETLNNRFRGNRHKDINIQTPQVPRIDR
ncbi:MAG: right-handed parallel beta-helix repeat-containing protein [bacterium]